MKNIAFVIFCFYTSVANAAFITQTFTKDSTNFFQSTEFELFDTSLGTLTDVSVDIDLSLDVFDFDSSGLCTAFGDCAGDITLSVDGANGLSELSFSDAQSVSDEEVDEGVTVGLSILASSISLFNFSDFVVPAELPSLDISVFLAGNSFEPFEFLNESGEVSLTYEYEAAAVSAPSTFAIFSLGIIGLLFRNNFRQKRC